jgi:septal ring factor EnvC (AmiA/AmiB activator)
MKADSTMRTIARARSRLPVALLLVGAVAATAAVTGYAAPDDAGPPALNQLSDQVAQLSNQIATLNGNVTALQNQVGQMNGQVAQLADATDGLETKLTEVNTRTIDISTDIQLLKQLANSTHDRLTAVCRKVNDTEIDVDVFLGFPDVSPDWHSCWRNYYDPGFAAKFSSRWTDPLP